MTKYKSNGRFHKQINELEVVGWYDGYPLSTEIKVGTGALRLHGIEQAKDLVYALQAMISDYENP